MNDRLEARIVLFGDQLRARVLLVSDLAYKSARSRRGNHYLLNLLFYGATPINLFTVHRKLLELTDKFLMFVIKIASVYV
jgi:hypothetical protein